MLKIMLGIIYHKLSSQIHPDNYFSLYCCSLQGFLVCQVLSSTMPSHVHSYAVSRPIRMCLV